MYSPSRAKSNTPAASVEVSRATMSRLVALALLSAALAAAAPPARILVAYYSETGNTEKMAAAVREGAASVDGASVTLRKVVDVTDEEIRSADGIVLGSPVQWGNLSA